VAMRDIQQPIFCLFRGFRRRSLPAHGTEPGFTGERDMAGLSARRHYKHVAAIVYRGWEHNGPNDPEKSQ